MLTKQITKIVELIRGYKIINIVSLERQRKLLCSSLKAFSNNINQDTMTVYNKLLELYYDYFKKIIEEESYSSICGILYRHFIDLFIHVYFHRRKKNIIVYSGTNHSEILIKLLEF